MSEFDNLEVAFQDKSNKDLNRSYFLFKTIKNPIISNILIVILKIAIWLNLPIKKIIKATVYKHFCGGITIDDCQTTIHNLWKYNIGTILDFSCEGKEKEEDFNRALNETIESIKKAKKEKSIPFAVFKLTGLARFSLLEKISNKSDLNKEEELEKRNFIERVERICKTAHSKMVPVFIDAEESWIQNAIDDISLQMMKQFNKDRCLIFNSLQMYRIDRLEYLKSVIQDAKENNYFIGLKLVRGAYHEQEIERSKKYNYPCPVHIKKERTDEDYNQALIICVENIDQVSICAGTHNEESSELLIQLLSKHSIAKNDTRVFFSQLLGMSDHISYNAAKKGFNVAKYVPYGPIRDVLPYLIRRAKENTSIAGQMGRELTNIINEKKRRGKL